MNTKEYSSATNSTTEVIFAVKKSEDEIIKLKQEFYGVGVDLKVLWKRIKFWFAK